MSDSSLPDLPVVYLDQNHWVTLACAIHAPNKIAEKRERRGLADRSRSLRADGVAVEFRHFVETLRRRDRVSRQ
jgi:hypothetical protein